jgi:hypothetical protein
MQPKNHPIYSIDTKVNSSIFYNDLSLEEKELIAIMTADDKDTR